MTTMEEIRDKLVAVDEAGAGYVILSVVGGSRHTLRQFANEIIPEFNSDRATAGRTGAICPISLARPGCRTTRTHPLNVTTDACRCFRCCR